LESIFETIAPKAVRCKKREDQNPDRRAFVPLESENEIVMTHALNCFWRVIHRAPPCQNFARNVLYSTHVHVVIAEPDC
jgi:hypothetical protein